MSPTSYQFHHPWHWLTYGQNAAAVQALCAVTALIGLFLYTRYTRRMMTVSELTRRASLTPVFAASGIEPHYLNNLQPTPDSVVRVSMNLRNVGEGVAVVVWSWYQPVSENFSVFDSGILKQPSSAPYGYIPVTSMTKGEIAEIHFDAYDLANPAVVQEGFLTKTFPSDKRWLFVVDAVDQAQGRHQLKMVMRCEEKPTTDMTMVHSLGDTFGERWMHSVARVVEVLSATKTELSKLFKK